MPTPLPTPLPTPPVPGHRPALTPEPKPAPPLDLDELRRRRLQKARRIAEINSLVYEHFRARDYARCEELLDQIIELDPGSAVAYYNLACVHSRLGRPANAIECLKTAVRKGYGNFRQMVRDPDLAAIRSEEQYKQLVAQREQLQRERARRIYQDLRQQFGKDYLVQIDHDNKLVFATNIDAQTLACLQQRLTRHAQSLWQDLFCYGFEQYVTVVIPHAWPYGSGIGGVYRHAERMLTVKSAGKDILHEFTHALHFADQDGRGQSHPIWIAEGLATLFETSDVAADGRVVPRRCKRLGVLKEAVAAGRHISFRSLLAYDQAQFMRTSALAYAEARYIMMYLHEQGLLKSWYEAYAAGFEKDPTGAEALEIVLGKKPPDVEAHWLRWVRSLPPLDVAVRTNRPYLGIRMAVAADGLRVRQIVAASGAAIAGVRLGDVIVGIDGQCVLDPSDVVRLVNARQVGDSVEVRLRRDGEYHTVRVKLHALPARLEPKSKARAAGQGDEQSRRPDRPGQTAPPGRVDAPPPRTAGGQAAVQVSRKLANS